MDNINISIIPQAAGQWNQNGIGGNSVMPQPELQVYAEPGAAVSLLSTLQTAKRELPWKFPHASISSQPPSAPEKKPSTKALAPKTAPVIGQPFQDYHRARGLSKKVDDGYLGYDPLPLFGNANEEFSFEEIRAQRWLKKNALTMNDFTVEMEEVDLLSFAIGLVSFYVFTF